MADLASKINPLFVGPVLDGDRVADAGGKVMMSASERSSLTVWQQPAYTVEEGYYYQANNGTKVANSGWHNAKVALTGAEYGVRATATVSGGATALAVYFDAAGAYISSQFVGPNGSDAIYTNQVLTVPASARSVAITGKTGTTVKLEIQATRDNTASDLDANIAATTLAAATANAARDALRSWQQPTYTVEEGYYYQASNGNKVANSGWHNAKVALTGAEYGVRATATVTGGATALAVYFDAAGAFISSQFVGPNGSDAIYTNQVLTVPTSARSVAITGKTGAIVKLETLLDRNLDAADNKAAAALAAAATAQATADAAISALRVWQQPTYTVEEGYYYQSNNGTKVANSGWHNAKVALAGTEYGVRATATVSGTATALAVYFDAAGAFISSQFVGLNGSDTVYTNQLLTVPVTARSVAITGKTGTTVKLETLVAVDLTAADTKATTALANAATAQASADRALASISGWYSPAYVVNENAYISRSSGAQVAFSGWRNLVYTLVGTEQSVRASAVVTGSATALAVYTNAAGTVLGYQFIGVDGTNTTYANQVLTLPTGTKNIGITGKTTSPIDIQVYDLLPVASKIVANEAAIAAQGARLTTLEAGAVTFYTGKSIVWFGTSIPKGTNGSGGSYPPKVAALLGATVTNEAWGSSMCRAGKKSLASGAVVVGSISGTVLTVTSVLYGTVATGQAISAAIIAGGTTTISSFGTGTGGVGTYNLSGSGSAAAGATIFLGSDPLGWTGLAWQNVCYSLAMYVGEKNELINNWAKWRPLLTNSPPTSPDATEQALWIERSFENCLVSRHLGANRKALYLLDHGHNDWGITGDGGDMLTVPTIADDRLTFLGAMRFIINLILADNQRARLMIVGHYEADRKVDIAAAQTKLAAIWQFPFYKTWERMGISQVSLTVAGTTKTMSQWRMPDDLHLHSDTTGAETTLMAQQISAWIGAQR